ncbi:MAG: ABC transporter ATP-binding protein, partial [Neofamilia sp.]
LILDEPAKHVSEEFTFDIGEFLLQFSDQMNRQIIMITHNPHLASLSKSIYTVTQENGISKVEKSID